MSWMRKDAVSTLPRSSGLGKGTLRSAPSMTPLRVTSDQGASPAGSTGSALRALTRQACAPMFVMKKGSCMTSWGTDLASSAEDLASSAEGLGSSAENLTSSGDPSRSMSAGFVQGSCPLHVSGRPTMRGRRAKASV